MRFNVNNKYAVPSIVGVVCLAAGFGLGWWGANKKRSMYLKKHYDVATQEEFDRWDIQPGDPETSPLQEWIEVEDEQLEFEFVGFEHEQTSFEIVHSEEPEEEGVVTIDSLPEGDQEYLVNVFRSDDDDWDMEYEVSTRTPDRPYIIHWREYADNESDYMQATLSYYAGDDVLVDDDNVPIYDYRRTFGELKFGHGSEGNKDIVYVRNEKREAEWEICRFPGAYITEVLGEEIEHQHKPRKGKKHPKFKLD